MTPKFSAAGVILSGLALTLSGSMAGCSIQVPSVSKIDQQLVDLDGYWVTQGEANAMLIRDSGIYAFYAYEDTGVMHEKKGTLRRRKDGKFAFKPESVGAMLGAEQSKLMEFQKRSKNAFEVIVIDETTGQAEDRTRMIRITAEEAEKTVSPYPMSIHQDYRFAHEYCQKKDSLSPSEQSTVDTILGTIQTTTIDGEPLDVQKVVESRRSVTGREISECEVLEDILERGVAYAATGSHMSVWSHGGNFESKARDSAHGLDTRVLSSLDYSELSLPVTPAMDLSWLSRKRVSRLSLNLPSGSATDLASLGVNWGEMKRLHSLSLDGGFSAIAQLSVVKNLRKLEIWNSGISQADIEAISSLATLQELSLDVRNSEELDFSPITRMKQLKRLSLSVPVRSLIEIAAELPNLEGVSFSRIRPADLTEIRKISKQVHELHVMMDSANSDLSGLRGLNHLESLSLSGQGGSIHLDHILGLPRLQSLHISYSGIQNVSKLRQLIEASRDMHVSLYEVSVPEDQKAALEKLAEEYPHQLTVESSSDDSGEQ